MSNVQVEEQDDYTAHPFNIRMQLKKQKSCINCVFNMQPRSESGRQNAVMCPYKSHGQYSSNTTPCDLHDRKIG